jgi:thioredoxin reductase
VQGGLDGGEHQINQALLAEKRAELVNLIHQRARALEQEAIAKGAAAAAKGVARESRVAELVGGKVSRQPIKTRFGSTDIDVIGPAGEFIAVGGPGKAINLSKFGSQLKVLQEAASQRGVIGLAAAAVRKPTVRTFLCP